jgi:hypothetical protein
MMDDNTFNPEIFKAIIDSHEGCWNKHPDEILKFWCTYYVATKDDLAFRYEPDTMSVQQAFDYIAHVKGKDLLPQNIPQNLLDAINLHYQRFWTDQANAQMLNTGHIPPYHAVVMTLIMSLYSYHEAYARMDAGEKVTQLDMMNLRMEVTGFYMLRDYLKIEDERRKGIIDRIEPDFTVRNFFSEPQRKIYLTELGQALYNNQVH